MNILKLKLLGEFIEEREGVKVIVKKYEEVTPVEEHNDKIEQHIAELESLKIED